MFYTSSVSPYTCMGRCYMLICFMPNFIPAVSRCLTRVCCVPNVKQMFYTSSFSIHSHMCSYVHNCAIETFCTSSLSIYTHMGRYHKPHGIIEMFYTSSLSLHIHIYLVVLFLDSCIMERFILAVYQFIQTWVNIINPMASYRYVLCLQFITAYTHG